MSFGKKVVIAVDLQQTTATQMKELRDLEFLKHAEIHFVHVYQTTNVIFGMGEFTQVFPVENDRKSIEAAILPAMVKLAQDIIAGQKVIVRCLFDENPKEEFCLYAKEIQADTMILFSRNKHGIFDSSFSQYAARHSSCNLIILKGKETHENKT